MKAPNVLKGKKNWMLNSLRCHCKSVSRAGPGSLWPCLSPHMTSKSTKYLYPARQSVAELTRSAAILWGICRYSVYVKQLLWTWHRYTYLNTNISVCTWSRTEASYEITLLYLKYIFTRGIGVYMYFTTKESIWHFMTGFLWMSSNTLRSMFILFICFDTTWDKISFRCCLWTQPHRQLHKYLHKGQSPSRETCRKDCFKRPTLFLKQQRWAQLKR